MIKFEQLEQNSFDQQLDFYEGKIDGVDVSPNRIIPAEVIFEPLGDGLRVTARDQQHRILWGFVANKRSLDQLNASVAVYDQLRELLTNAFGSGSQNQIDANSLDKAQAVLDELQTKIDALKSTIVVKKASEATQQRAAAVMSVANNLIQILTTEMAAIRSSTNQ